MSFILMMYIQYTLGYDSYEEYDTNLKTKVMAITMNFCCYYVWSLLIILNNKGKMNIHHSDFNFRFKYLR